MDGNPSGAPRRRTVTPRAGGRTRRHRKATGMRASERHGSSAARTRSGTCRSAAARRGSLYPGGVAVAGAGGMGPPPGAPYRRARSRAIRRRTRRIIATAGRPGNFRGQRDDEKNKAMVYPCGCAWWMLRLRRSRLLRGKACFCHLPLHDQPACCLRRVYYFCIFWMDDLDPIAGTWYFNCCAHDLYLLASFFFNKG